VSGARAERKTERRGPKSDRIEWSGAVSGIKKWSGAWAERERRSSARERSGAAQNPLHHKLLKVKSSKSNLKVTTKLSV